MFQISLQECIQVNIDVDGITMNPHGELTTKGPLSCQNICRQTTGCFWFTWKLKNPMKERIGKCTLISRRFNMLSNSSTKEVFSGPNQCGGMKSTTCQGHCDIREGPCYDHNDCKTGLKCGKDNCIQMKNFKKVTYDCCEKSN